MTKTASETVSECNKTQHVVEYEAVNLQQLSQCSTHMQAGLKY